MSPRSTALPARPLGEGGIEVSAVGLGCNNFGRRIDLDATGAVLEAALDAGITLLDTADIYGQGESERLMGEVLKGRWDEVVLASKFGMTMRIEGTPERPRGSRDYIRWAIEGSLGRLGTDRIDVYQYHEPDGQTPIGETLRALAELVAEGMVGQIGCSNFSAAQIEEADELARAEGLPRFLSVQNEYSLLKREIEAEVTPACERLGLGILPFYPLASGLLTGKYRRGRDGPEGARLSGRETIGTEAEFDVVEAVEAYAKSRGLEPVSVAIGGLAAQSQVSSVIAGASTPEQVRANVAALDWSPSAEDLRELDEIAPTPRTG